MRRHRSTLAAAALLAAAAPTLFPNLPFAELVALMRANPGKLSYSSAGSGSNFHMAGELFKEMSKTFALHVPYRGGGPALLDTISGQVEFSFPSLTAALPQATAGPVRALAVTMKAPQVRERYAREGTVERNTSPEEASAFLKDEVARWGKIIRERGIKGA
jgi:tripartite-type tricarboxylate transporter receptor subunit TctC